MVWCLWSVGKSSPVNINQDHITSHTVSRQHANRQIQALYCPVHIVVIRHVVSCWGSPQLGICAYTWNNWTPKIKCRATWWRHQIEAFPRYWSFVRGIHGSPVHAVHQGPVMRSFGVFVDLRLNKRLSKRSKRRWFETLSRSLRRHCNERA